MRVADTKRHAYEIGMLLSCPIRASVEIWKLYGCFLVILFTVCLPKATCPVSRADEPIDEQSVLQLSPGDSSVKPDVIIKLCSSVLSERKHFSASDIRNAYKRRAAAYSDLKQYQQAHKDYESLYKLSPKDPESRWLRAESFCQLGAIAEGTVEYEVIIKEHPSFIPAYTSLAARLALANDLDRAIKLASKAVSLAKHRDADLAYAYFIRGISYFNQSETSRCLDDFNQAILIDPCGNSAKYMGQLYYLRGMTLLQLGRPAEALPNFFASRRLGTDTIANIGIARAYLHLDRVKLARLVAERLVRKDPNSVPVQICYVATLIANKDLRSALSAGNRAVELNGNEPLAHCALAAARLGLGEYLLALRSYDKALDLSPNHRKALLGKSFLLATCPDDKLRDGAILKKLMSQLQKMPQDSDYRLSMILAMAHAECNEWTESICCAQRSVKLLESYSDGKVNRYRLILKLFQKKRPYRFDPNALNFDFYNN